MQPIAPIGAIVGENAAEDECAGVRAQERQGDAVEPVIRSRVPLGERGFEQGALIRRGGDPSRERGQVFVGPGLDLEKQLAAADQPNAELASEGEDVARRGGRSRGAKRSGRDERGAKREDGG